MICSSPDEGHWGSVRSVCFPQINIVPKPVNKIAYRNVMDIKICCNENEIRVFGFVVSSSVKKFKANFGDSFEHCSGVERIGLLLCGYGQFRLGCFCRGGIFWPFPCIASELVFQ